MGGSTLGVDEIQISALFGSDSKVKTLKSVVEQAKDELVSCIYGLGEYIQELQRSRCAEKK